LRISEFVRVQQDRSQPHPHIEWREPPDKRGALAS
jgi:hypothetical protein